MIQWPIIYIRLILELFEDSKDLLLGDFIGDLFDRELTVYASRTGSGLDWELVVQVAILMQCLNAKVNAGRGPFSTIVAPAESCSAIEHIQLTSNVTNVIDADTFLMTLMDRATVGTIMVATPQFMSFPTLDGFVYFKQTVRLSGEIGPPMSHPRRAELSGFCIPDSRNTCRISILWRYCSCKEIDDLLGASLSLLKPTEWPPHPALDSFR
jgi:hypothetical protein